MKQDVHSKLIPSALSRAFYLTSSKGTGLLRFRFAHFIPVFLLYILLMPLLGQAQTNTLLESIDASDTMVLPVPKFYQNIQKTASKRAWSRHLHSFFFRDPPLPLSMAEQGSMDLQYEPYRGKTIESITVIVLSPFGTNVDKADSSSSSNRFDAAGNKLHVNTREHIVRNHLLFKQGEAVIPLNIAESEALLRSTGFINDVAIHIDSIPSTNAVEVTVTLRDLWSIGVNVRSMSSSSADVETFNRNFIGLGSTLSVRTLFDNQFEYPLGYGGSYFYRNIVGSFIDARVSYMNVIRSQETAWAVERNLQPTIKYFGQIGSSKIDNFTNVVPWDSISPTSMHWFSIALGRAFNLDTKRTGRRITFAARYQEQTPTFPPYFKQDTLLYSNIKSRMVLTQLSLFRQRYYREHMIHNFGVIENIAHGYNLSAQLGYKWWPGFTNGTYASFSSSMGVNRLSGNYFLHASVSSFFNQSGPYQGVLKMEMRYFSPLLKINRSRFRQFLSVDYTKSLNPYDRFTDWLYYSTLTHMNTSPANEQTQGLERLMINLESNLFTPIYVAGFRYMFFNFYDMGWISSGNKLIHSNNFYWGAGLGIRVRNDLLVFRTLEIKMGWYPRLNRMGFNNYFSISSSDPMVSPNFVPGYPQEIQLR